MAGEENKAGDCERRRQGWEKSCLVRKEKDHETGDTEEETFFFSVPSAAVSKQAEKVKKHQRQNILTSCCENKMKFVCGPSGFGHLKRTRALQRSVALGSRHASGVGQWGGHYLSYQTSCFLAWKQFKFKFSGEGGRKRGRERYAWCLCSTFLQKSLKKIYISCVVWVFIFSELLKFHCWLIVVKDLCIS